MDEFVEVIDIVAKTTTPGLTLVHTIRPHEGDVVNETDDGGLRIQFGPREAKAGNVKRRVPGPVVTIYRVHMAEVTTTTRLEPKIRPSVKMALDREAAELEALKKKHDLA